MFGTHCQGRINLPAHTEQPFLSGLMADDMLKRLQGELKCSICSDTFNDPKLLQCFHVYCQKCLVPLVDRDQEGQLSLTCPTCRLVTPIPDKGVAGLQPAFHLHHLLDELKDHGTIQEDAAAPSRCVTKLCIEHGGKAELYCATCEMFMCYKCVIRSGKHQDHDYKELDQQYDEKMSS